jgi:hypothetical protein
MLNTSSDSKMSSQDIKYDIDYSDQNVYINIEQYNPIKIGYTSPELLASNITNSMPIIDDPSKYRLAVARFKIPTSSFPLFFFPEEKVADQIYRVAVRDDTDPNNVIEVQKPVKYQTVCNDCYYTNSIFYYQQFVDMINQAYSDANDEMKTINPTWNSRDVSPPYLKYIAESSSLVMYFDQNYITYDYYCSMSELLYNEFFPSFYSTTNYTTPQTLLPTILNIQDLLDNKTTIDGTVYYKLTSESDSVQAWNQLSQIILTSNTIPVISESISSADAKTRLILTDFEPIPSIQNYLPYQFQPSLYRWINLQGSNPLYQIDVQFLVSYKTGEVKPIYIAVNESFSIKLLFRKNSELTV